MSIYPHTPIATHTSCSPVARQDSMWDNLDWLLKHTSVMSGLAAVSSLTGPRQRVP